MSDSRVRFATLMIAAAMLVLAAFNAAAYTAIAYLSADWGHFWSGLFTFAGRLSVAIGLIQIARDA